MTDYTLAANFIEQFESYLPEARWDVNHYRLGYGSDTEGPNQANVIRGMVTTRERAFDNLKARIPQFERVIIEQVGSPRWSQLPAQAQAALLSVAYNYGHLPVNVAYEVMQGRPLAFVASAIEAHRGDNHGVNASRRDKEAHYIATA